MIKTGSLIDQRYEVLEVLGHGGMGTVYQVRHLHLDHIYALKELESQAQGATHQFQLEAQILAKLQHPGLPRVIDYFSRKHRHYLVMDYIDGQDLDNLLQNTSHLLTEQQIRPWLVQLLDILAYIHAQGIIHRDLKPANIKLNPQGQIILVDFGIAKQTTHTSAQTAFGAKGAFTPFLAAPEQIQGLSTDARTDIYALGATTSYLLTRILPPPLNISEHHPQVSPGLCAWVKQAMARLPTARFQNVEAMKEALLAGGVPLAKPITSGSGFRRDIRRF